MKVESVRELKQALSDSLAKFSPPVTMASAQTVLGSSTRSIKAASAVGPVPIALGIAARKKKEYALAVRVQQRTLASVRAVELIEKQARGEVDLRHIGPVVKRNTGVRIPWYRQRTRPLRMGSSVGHYSITAGTLGAFVRERGGTKLCVLSNNHVLADENRGKVGDAILQPGAFDLGHDPDDAIGTLSKFIRLKARGINQVDSALAELHSDQKIDLLALRGLGKLTGLGDDFLDVDTPVAKIGRTTGLKRGRITAFELDGVYVNFDAGALRFDNQIEIEGAGKAAFSDGGDSGSLIVDEDRRAIGLLFAGGDQGGTNGQGLTFANPIHVVLDLLQADLVLSL